MPLDIVLATQNPHKLDELRAILHRRAADTLIRLRLLSDLPGHPFPEPAETGSTFESNAAIKALAYAHATGLPCLADDSGLEIDALQGRPGVISSHYSTNGVETGLPRAERDRLNNQRVLQELANIPAPERSARFVCVMALAMPAQPPKHPEPRILCSVRGSFEGRIGTPPHVPRGDQGFGYDPIFLVAPDFSLTSAQLPPELKNQLSHRAAAAGRLAHFVRSFPSLR